MFLDHPQTGSAFFKLMSPCSKCTQVKMTCTRIMPCTRCVRSGHVCKPSDVEFVTRARAVIKALRQGLLIHVDIAKYQLHLEAMVEKHVKGDLGRIDAADLSKRVGLIQPIHPYYLRGDMNVKLPQEMIDLRAQYPVNKIEWFCDGVFTSEHSQEYDNNIMDVLDERRLANIVRIPKKLVDTGNLADPLVMHNMWAESVAFPGKMVIYRGHGLWMGDMVVCYTTVRMMSFVLTGTRFVTVTTMERGTILKL